MDKYNSPLLVGTFMPLSPNLTKFKGLQEKLVVVQEGSIIC